MIVARRVLRFLDVDPAAQHARGSYACKSRGRFSRAQEWARAKAHKSKQCAGEMRPHYGVQTPEAGMPGVVSGRGLKSAGTGLGMPLSVGVICNSLQPAPP